MKKEKNIQDEEKKIVEVIETENFEVSKTGSLADDLMHFEKIGDIKVENLEFIWREMWKFFLFLFLLIYIKNKYWIFYKIFI